MLELRDRVTLGENDDENCAIFNATGMNSNPDTVNILDTVARRRPRDRAVTSAAHMR